MGWGTAPGGSNTPVIRTRILGSRTRRDQGSREGCAPACPAEGSAAPRPDTLALGEQWGGGTGLVPTEDSPGAVCSAEADLGLLSSVVGGGWKRRNGWYSDPWRTQGHQCHQQPPCLGTDGTFGARGAELLTWPPSLTHPCASPFLPSVPPASLSPSVGSCHSGCCCPHARRCHQLPCPVRPRQGARASPQ